MQFLSWYKSMVILPSISRNTQIRKGVFEEYIPVVYYMKQTAHHIYPKPPIVGVCFSNYKVFVCIDLLGC